jgi:IclR family acetate operon transcriptional repressor
MTYPQNRSLRRAFAILECLNSTRQGLTSTEISRRTGVASATTHRLLREMYGLGYVSWDRATRTYTIGFALTLFGNKRLVVERIVRRARPMLQALSRRSRLTAYIGSLDGAQIVIEDRVVHGPKAHHAPGTHVDAHAHSIGKALLAPLSKREVLAMYDPAPMRAHTRNTIRGVDVLLKDLAHVRASGYAVDDEELVPGIRSLASALINPKGRAMCAIAVEGPKRQLDPESIAALVPLLAETGARIMQDIVEPAAPTPRSKSGQAEVDESAPT